MAQNTTGSSLIIKSMEKVCIHGMIKEFLKEVGYLIKWKVKEYLNGQMEGGIKVLIKMTKNMDMGNLIGELILIF